MCIYFFTENEKHKNQYSQNISEFANNLWTLKSNILYFII